MRDAGAYAADGGYVVRSMWILWMTSSLSSHSTSASVSELSRLVTHTAVSSPKCNSEKRPLSNSVAFRTLFKWHRYCGILKIHIVRKINTGIRYEPVYCPALIYTYIHTGAGHIIRISSKSWFISLIPFKKWNLYNVYIHSTQTDIFQVFISFNFDDEVTTNENPKFSISENLNIVKRFNIEDTWCHTLIS